MDVRKHVRWLFDAKGDLPRLALGGAWLFAVGSLLPLLWLIWFSGGGLLQAGYVFDTVVGGERYAMPLLAYSGWLGLLLLWTQVLGVTGAVLLTVFPRRVPLRWRRVGHFVLIGWNALWVLGTWRLALVDWGFWFHALFVTALAGCTLYRARRGWKQQPSQPPAMTVSPASERETGARESPNFFAESRFEPSSPPASRRGLHMLLERAKVFATSMWRRGARAFRSGLVAPRDGKHTA